MRAEFVDLVLTFSLDDIGTMTLAAILLLIGYWIKSKVHSLEKSCIPVPVVGGFLFVLINFGFYLSGAVSSQFGSTFQSVLMLAFFTTVGLGASLRVLPTGGKLLVIYWLVNVVVTVLQTGTGTELGPMVGLHAACGIISGLVVLVGGHGGAAAYGQMPEAMGYPGASFVGFTAATFGLIAVNLISGPLGRHLIIRYRLESKPEEIFEIDVAGHEMEATERLEMDYAATMKNLTALMLCMTFEAVIVGHLDQLVYMPIPIYVGAMFSAVLVRNLNEKYHFYEFRMSFNDKVGDAILGLYLLVALMMLKLWELAALALPLFIVLVTQTVPLVLLTHFVVSRILGRNYDTAVVCTGLIGHDIGSIPTAVTNMIIIQEKYGEPCKALIIVPIVGVFLIDVFYQPFVIWCINILCRPLLLCAAGQRTWSNGVDFFFTQKHLHERVAPYMRISMK